MATQDLPELRAVLDRTIAKIRQNRDRPLGEQNTKGMLIEPILDVLGWDTRDWAEVHREYKAKAADKPVDYALKIGNMPRLFVEAKGLGEHLQDRKWVAQILSYATVAGVEWCVLTDGDEYRFYNTTAAVDAEEKLFWKLRLSDGSPEEAATTLALISRSNMEGNRIDALWEAHFVDRRVKQALLTMLDSADKSLVRLLRKRTPKLTPKAIIGSLRRLKVQIDAEPVCTTTGVELPPGPRERPRGRPQRGTRRRHDFGVTLADVISAGILTPPAKLYRKYRGQMLEATLLQGGSVEFQGKQYPSGSTAAAAARGSITGRPMHTNGWSFWQTRDEAGKLHELAEARSLYLNARG